MHKSRPLITWGQEDEILSVAQDDKRDSGRHGDAGDKGVWDDKGTQDDTV